MDLNTLEISKDSFIEKELADYYSDILYRVNLTGGSQGLVYVLFEHKSYYDQYVHLQLLEYMNKIWRLHIKQHKCKGCRLPIVIPLVICHAGKEWPEDTERLTSLLSGPVDELVGYIPDFGFELYDLHRYSDDQIKGTIMSRVILLLLKHIRDPDLRQKLPGNQLPDLVFQAPVRTQGGLLDKDIVLETHQLDAPHSVLLFYKGNCPLCEAALIDLANKYQGLKQRNVRVIAASGDENPQAFEKKLPF